MIAPTSKTEPLVKLFINVSQSRYIVIDCPEGLTQRVLNFVLSLTIPQAQTILAARPLKNLHLTLSYVPRPSTRAVSERLLLPQSVDHSRVVIKDVPDMNALRWRERGVRLYPEADLIEFATDGDDFEICEVSSREVIPMELSPVLNLIDSLRLRKYCPLTYLAHVIPVLEAIATALKSHRNPNYQEAREIKRHILENFDDVFSTADPTILHLVDFALFKRDPHYHPDFLEVPNFLKTNLFRTDSLNLLRQITRQYRVSARRKGGTLESVMNEMIHLLKSNTPLTFHRYFKTEHSPPDFWKTVIVLQLIDSHMYNLDGSSKEVYLNKIRGLVDYILNYKGPKGSSVFLQIKKWIVKRAKEFFIHPLNIVQSVAWLYFVQDLRVEVASIKTRNVADTIKLKRSHPGS